MSSESVEPGELALASETRVGAVADVEGHVSLAIVLTGEAEYRKMGRGNTKVGKSAGGRRRDGKKVRE